MARIYRSGLLTDKYSDVENCMGVGHGCLRPNKNINYIKFRYLLIYLPIACSDVLLASP